MGNVKSKNSPYAGHEKLNENDERYFAKVHARNSTTRPSRRRFGRRKRSASAMKGCVTALTNTSPPREDDAFSLPDDGSTLSGLYPKSYQPVAGPPKIAGPLKMNLSPKTEGSPVSVRLPSPRNETSRIGARTSPHRTPSQRRLEKARSNQIRPTDAMSPSDTLSISSSRSSNQSVIQDYYTDMLDEAHRESQQANAEGQRDSSRSFDSMLPSGMVWTEISRGGKVTCVAFSRSSNKDAPQFMAIGADDGTVAIMEILDTPSSPLHKQIDFGSNRSKKTRLVKEFPREGTVRSLDFSQDGRWLAVGGDDCIACLMRLQVTAASGSENTVNSVEMVQEFEREDRVYSVQFSPDGSMLAVGGFDGMIAIMSVGHLDGTHEPSSRPTRPLALLTEIAWPRLVLSLDWSPDGSMLAVGGSGKCCTILDDSWSVVAEIRRNASVAIVKWNPTGSHIALGCSNGTVAVVHVESQTVSGEIVRGVPRMITNGDGETRSGSSSLAGGSCHVSSLCWSPDGGFLAIGGSDDCCAIVETKKFALVHETRRSGHVTCLAWNQRRLVAGNEARYLAIGGEDRAIAIMKTVVSDEDGDVSDAESDDFHSVASSSYFSVGSLSQHEWVLREDSFRDIEDSDSFALEPSPSCQLDDAPLDTVVTAVSFSRHKKGTSSRYMAVAKSDGGVTIMNTKGWHVVEVRGKVGATVQLCKAEGPPPPPEVR